MDEKARKAVEKVEKVGKSGKSCLELSNKGLGRRKMVGLVLLKMKVER